MPRSTFAQRAALLDWNFAVLRFRQLELARAKGENLPALAHRIADLYQPAVFDWIRSAGAIGLHDVAGPSVVAGGG